MTWTILQLAFPLVFVGVALYLYHTNRTALVEFREQLAVSPKGKRFVILMTLLSLLVYHFVALCGKSIPLDLLPSSILVFLLFSQKYGEIAIRLFQGKRWSFFAFLVILASFTQTATASLGMTFLVLLIVSWIYPTKALEKEMSERGDTHDIIEETIEGLRNVMVDIHTPIQEPEEPDEEDNGLVDTVAEEVVEETSEEIDADMQPVPRVDKEPSGAAVQNQKRRERERAHRRSRAKRRARRAKNGR